MSRRIIGSLVAVILLALLAPAALAGDAPDAPGSSRKPAFSKKAGDAPALLQLGPDRHWCPICGMKLALFWKTSHAAHLHDGSARQYCSLHCLAEDQPSLGAGVARVSVVDAGTDELIEAEAATYVVGSDVPGTMSATSKLAFADRTAAASFQTAHGGRLATYAEALRAAREGAAADRAQIATRKRLKVHPKGKKIWKTACRHALAVEDYDSVARLKAALATEKGCPGLPEPKLQAVALYLWDVVRAHASEPARITVRDGAKCPVCGMFVAKYPHWAASAKAQDGPVLYFDGVKDLAKYLLEPAKYGGVASFEATWLFVTDYYTLAALDPRGAWFVVGSAVKGPMGHEPIPFATETHARTFLADHGGERLIRWDDITLALLEELDARP